MDHIKKVVSILDMGVEGFNKWLEVGIDVGSLMNSVTFSFCCICNCVINRMPSLPITDLKTAAHFLLSFFSKLVPISWFFQHSLNIFQFSSCILKD